MTRRKTITAALRVRVWDAYRGTCCLCHFKIDKDKQKWIVEHVKPLWLNGEDDERNMGPAHEHCARDKTAAEAPVRAKGTRVRARYLGAHRPKQLIRGWQKFDRTPVLNPKLRRARS